MPADTSREALLVELPLALNSSLETTQVVAEALRSLEAALSAEAATVFLVTEGGSELEFWALHGGSNLKGRRIPFGRGIVGSVIDSRQGALVRDVQADPRFFSDVDEEGGFRTKDLICAPLVVRSARVIGALQVLNSSSGFSQEDLDFLMRCAHIIAPALDNARLYEQVVAQNERLTALDRKKGEIAAIIAHEFRTPLSIIRTAAEMLTSGMLTAADAQQKMAQTLDKGVERLVRAVSQVSNLALVSREEIDLSREKIRASDLLESLARQFEPAAQGRKLEFRIEDGSGSASITADRALVSVALANLISNAVRFTPDGGSVALSAEKRLGLLTFSVTDTGIGIPESELKAVFDKFYEVQSAALHSSGTFEFRSCGLGLGLSTAQAILRAHGTALKVESRPGQGSRFFFDLPVA